MTDGRIGWCESAKRPDGERIQENRRKPNSEEDGSRPVYGRGGAVGGRGPEGGGRSADPQVGRHSGQNKGWRLQERAPGMTMNPPGKNLEGAEKIKDK